MKAQSFQKAYKWLTKVLKTRISTCGASLYNGCIQFQFNMQGTMTPSPRTYGINLTMLGMGLGVCWRPRFLGATLIGLALVNGRIESL